MPAFTALASSYEETVHREVRELCGLGYRDLLVNLMQAVPVTDGQMVLDVASGTAVSSVEVARRNWRVQSGSWASTFPRHDRMRDRQHPEGRFQRTNQPGMRLRDADAVGSPQFRFQ